MKSIFAIRRLTLDDVITSEGFCNFEADRLGNNLYIDDPDRADRCEEAAADGADGSTHAEHMQDWRDYLGTCRKLPPRVRAKIEAEIDDCELYHATAGTLYHQVG